MSFVRTLTRSSFFQRVVGTIAAEWLRFVWLTNRWRLEPPGIYENLDPHLPVIVAFWHAVDGLKVVIDDYVSGEGNRWAWNTLILFLAVAGASLCLFALGRIAFGAAS